MLLHDFLALHPSTKGLVAADVMRGLARFAEATADPLPSWLTTPMIERTRERMRHLVGEWKATPRGSAMELTWPAR